MEKRLPILATLVAAIQLCINNLGFALKIMSPWFIIVLVVPNLIFTTASSSPTTLGFTPWEFVEFVIYMAGWASIAVLWHWRILRRSRQDRTPMTLDQRVWSYLIRGILIGIAAGGVALLAGAVTIVALRTFGQVLDPQVFSILAIIPAAVVALVFLARLSIALPAIALDVPGFGLSDAWRSTAGNGIRLLLVTVLPLVPLYVLAWIVGLPSMEESDFYSFSPGPFLLQIIQQIVDFAFGLIGLTVLSITYGFFAENKQAGNVQPSA